MQKLRLAIVLAFSIFLIAKVDPVQAEVHTYPTQPFAYHKGGNIYSSHWGPAASFDQDIVITAINFSQTGIPAGVNTDFCIYLTRANDPKLDARTAAGSEILCTTSRRVSNNSSWNGHYDLSSTPLYIPKGTNVYCETTGFNISNPSTIQFGCNLSYEIYQQGNPRFRSLRIPYVDQSSQSDGSIPLTIYNSNNNFPLHAKGFAVFQSFYPASGNAVTSDICLTHLKQGGALVSKVCAPNISTTFGTNYDGPTTIYPADLTIPPANFDILSGTCKNRNNNNDCAIFALVEIPESITRGGDSITANYGLVPTGFLREYCEFNVQALWHPFFCNGASSCSVTTKVNSCTNNLFPQASNTATTSPTPTPISSSRPSPSPINSPIPRPSSSPSPLSSPRPSPAPLPGDFNNDQRVNLQDYLILVSNFGSTYNLQDYLLLVANFGKTL